MRKCYIYIDESGDIGDPDKYGSSLDFSMSACVIEKENILKISVYVNDMISLLNKKELKFSKLSHKDRFYVFQNLQKLNLNIKTVYFKKSIFGNKDVLKKVFDELINKLNIDYDIPVKFIMDGDENKFYRKLYTIILNKYFKSFKIKFANSIKTPILQIADFYAGYEMKNRGTGV